jgi:hypothetical protein
MQHAIDVTAKEDHRKKLKDATHPKDISINHM